jgi:hypothetical protein
VTVRETLLRAVLARLTATTPAAMAVNRIRRVHRVAIARDDAPQVHLIDGPDERRAETHNRAACLPRECRFTVSIFVRANDDETFALADPLIEDVLARLDPMTGGGYAYGNATANLKFLDVTPEPEPADGDALRVDLKFVMSYDTSGFGLSA